MKLLQQIQKCWNSPSLQNVVIIGAQHIMESTLELFRDLKSKNQLDPRKVFLIGKCYSSSKSIYNAYRKEGFYISPRSFYYDSHISFDQYYEEQIYHFINEVLSIANFKGIEKIIVLDDGGYLIQSLSKLQKEDFPPIIAIEQTSAGYHFLKERNFAFPVINVARSRIKLKYETPYIVQSCIERLKNIISPNFMKNKRVLVLGKGNIGNEILNYLSQECEVRSYDPKENKEGELETKLTSADLVIGCSGYVSLPYNRYQYLKPGAYLISVSSSDREFEAHQFRQQFSAHDHIHQSFTKNGITLLNSGFPINFWGSSMNMPMEHIELTLALLLTAIFQSFKLKKMSADFLKVDDKSESVIENLISENQSFAEKSIQLWEKNAGSWTKLVESGKDLYRDHVCTPGFFSNLPDIKKKKGLDLGCGDGQFTRMLASKGAEMYGIDLCQKFLSYARIKEKENPLDIQYSHANALSLPFEDKSFDFTTCFFALIDMPEILPVLREAYRILKYGGFFQFVIPHPCTWLPDHEWKFDENRRKKSVSIGGYFSTKHNAPNEWTFEGLDFEKMKEKNLTFHSFYFRRTLSEWVAALIQAKFSIEQFIEPHCESKELIEKYPLLEGANVIPMYLIIRCRKHG